MTSLTRKMNRVWKTAQLYIGFHRDPRGRKRSKPHVWPPKNARASIHDDPERQEAFLVIKSAQEDRERDVQIKLRADKIVLRRDLDESWRGVIVTEHEVIVAVGDVSITINHDGSITRQGNSDTTWIEADGAVLKKTDYVEASMSGDGVDMVRRSPDSIAAITEEGIVTRRK